MGGQNRELHVQDEQDLVLRFGQSHCFFPCFICIINGMVELGNAVPRTSTGTLLIAETWNQILCTVIDDRMIDGYLRIQQKMILDHNKYGVLLS